MDENTKDQMTLMLVGILFLMGGGLSMVAGAVLPPVQEFMATAGILVPAKAAVFELADTGTGPSAWFLLALLGLLCTLIVLGPKLSRPKDGDRR
ncbi:hypothetical protein [Micrococcus luteus]|uniref:hypothetical protein n=1 Tax=Micrococcus luteus TaxID=1270 RepID=UPI0023044261|nr:hypothetical protein [Micrococcus luteus]